MQYKVSWNDVNEEGETYIRSIHFYSDLANAHWFITGNFGNDDKDGEFTIKRLENFVESLQVGDMQTVFAPNGWDIKITKSESFFDDFLSHYKKTYA
tara:strand:+ start:461 stop:751 length:291 start_codon:yes stop_codon:yes gene_type:complete